MGDLVLVAFDDGMRGGVALNFLPMNENIRTV